MELKQLADSHLDQNQAEALKDVAGLRASIRTWAISNRINGWQNEDDKFLKLERLLAEVEGNQTKIKT